MCANPFLINTDFDAKLPVSFPNDRLIFLLNCCSEKSLSLSVLAIISLVQPLHSVLFPTYKTSPSLSFRKPPQFTSIC